MRPSIQVHDGQGLINLLPRRPRETAKSTRRAALLRGPGEATERRLSERRGEALRRFFPKLSAWLADRIHMAQMRETERYLSQAVDVFDLEERIRRLERDRRLLPYN